MSIDENGNTTSKASQGMPNAVFLGPLRIIAVIAVVVGAAGSAGLMLYVGRANNSRILLSLFAIWVLSPFVALILANVLSTRWPVVDSSNTLYRDADNHAWLFGHLRRCCLRTAQSETSFLLPYCSPDIMAASRDRLASGRVHISQSVSMRTFLLCLTGSAMPLATTIRYAYNSPTNLKGIWLMTRIGLYVAAMLLFSTAILAQLDRGTITGTVTDPSGAVVPGTKIIDQEYVPRTRPGNRHRPVPAIIRRSTFRPAHTS